jgi:DNA-directed RNA polymerase subunit RPC12/RpoP
MEITGKISYKTQTGKAIKFEGSDKFYNAYKKEDLDSYVVGQTVKLTYEIKGNFQNISKIELVPDKQPEPNQATSSSASTPATGYKCVTCGKELKDNKYKNCYECNQKAKETKTATPEEEPKPLTTEPEVYLCSECGAKMKNNKYPTCYNCSKKKGFNKQKQTNYNNPERDAQIRRGNAINAAGAALSGNLQGSDPDAIKQALIYIAEGALTWLEEKNQQSN